MRKPGQNQRQLTNWSNRFEIRLLSSSFLKEQSSLCVFQIAEVYAKFEVKYKSDTK